MTPKPSQQKPEISDKMNALAQIVAMRSDELLAELGIRLYRYGNKYVGPCPIHGGDKSNALNLYPDGESVPGFWKCRSHHCESVFKKTIIGFVRGVLSHNQFNWQKKGDKVVSFEDTVKWCCDFVGQEIDSIKIDVEEQERRRFASQVDTIIKSEKKLDGVPRSLIKNSLAIPADYFIKRGYSPETLTQFDVGLCDKQGKEMYNRVVVPVYDDTRQVMIGCTGRSIYPECKNCECYHAPGTTCPSEEYRWLHSKWKHSKNFNTGSCLYNYWNAKKYIQETGVAILVEGPADVWRLVECGIYNVVALFGCELTEEQQVILESSGAMSLILLLDNDESGRNGVKEINDKLKRFYNIYIPQYTTHDIGQMTCSMIQKEIVPIVEGVQLKNKSFAF